MAPLERNVISFCEKHGLIKYGSTILVGVSGGPDSMALLHFLMKLRGSYQLNLIALSVDHMLRGKESQEDVNHVKEYCRKWNIQFNETSLDVPTYKKDKGLSTQVAARVKRYAFFEEQMNYYNADTLALGHHGDDQIETMIMRLMRGSTPDVLQGIPVERPFGNGRIIRPFLCLSKEEILDYCANNQISIRQDPSNDEAIYTRNAIRLNVLPLIKSFNPKAHIQMQQMSETIQQDEKYLMSQAEVMFSNIVHTLDNPRRASLKQGDFTEIPVPLQRRTFHLILNYLYLEQNVEISYSHFQQLIKLMESRLQTGVIHLPRGLKVAKSYNDIFFSFKGSEDNPEPFKFILGENDFVHLADGCKIVSKVYHQPKRPPEESNNRFICDLHNVDFPLFVRSRQHGDRIQVRGLNGSKKVKDIFIDEKIPHNQRDIWPIVTDANDKLIWVVGLKKGELKESLDSKLWLQLDYEEKEDV